MRPWSRFTIRALLLFVACLALVLAPVRREVRRYEREMSLRDELKRQQVVFKTVARPKTPLSRLAERLYGDEPRDVTEVIVPKDAISDELLTRLQGLRGLRVLRQEYWSTSKQRTVSPDVLRAFATLPELRAVDLSAVRMTTECVRALSHVPGLKGLALDHSGVSTAELRTLAVCRRLQFVSLAFNDLDGEAIDVLSKLPDLQYVSLAFNPRITLRDVVPLVRKSPHVVWDLTGTAICGPEARKRLTQLGARDVRGDFGRWGMGPSEDVSPKRDGWRRFFDRRSDRELSLGSRPTPFSSPLGNAFGDE